MGVVPVERLMQRLDYDDETGRLVWKDGPRSGLEAGSRTHKGYRHLYIDGVFISTHRAVWAIKTGSWPDGDIDHINGDGCDNRFCNLRDVPHSSNQRNLRLAKNNSTGVTGVTERRDCVRRFSARIKVSGRVKVIGCFHTLEEAAKARKEAEKKYGFHENHGACR